MGANGNAETRLVPVLRYRDVAAAVDWLCGAFGFEKQDIDIAVDGTIRDARLMFFNDMILLLPRGGVEPRKAKPGNQSRAQMRSCYLVVDDVDLHYHRAKAAGAEILKVTERDYGGRGYSCRDPEGHIWNFGTYDPWQPQSEARLDLMSPRDNVSPPIVIAAVVAAIIAALTAWWALAALPPRAPESGSIEASASLQRLVETGDSRVKEDGRARR